MMRWTNNRQSWKRRFALLPVSNGHETIWLRWYWAQFMGEYTAAVFDDECPEPKP